MDKEKLYDILEECNRDYISPEKAMERILLLFGVSSSLPTGTPRYCMECGSRIIKEELYCEYCRRQ